MLTTSNVSTYEDLMSVDENSNRETIERIGFYRSEIAKDVNIFTTFKLNPRARIVLDVTPKRFEDIGHQWKFLSDEMTIKVLSAFYLTVNSILDKTFEDDNHEGYLRALYIKYVGINVFKVGIKQSFDIEMTQYILEELTNKMLLQNTAIEEFFPGLWGIHSFEYFKEQIETALYDADHNRLSDIYNYIDRVSSLFADLEMSLSISRMSSGQESVFKMLSTIYNGIKEAESVRPRKSSVIIVIDEIDKYIHPEWERIILFEIQRLIKDSRLKCEVVFTTHSPIALSDLQSDSVVYIESLNSPPVKRYDFSTFIQNIHLLLRQPFFLDELQGKMGKSHIEDLILKLNEFEENPQRFNREIYEEYHTKVARIGEKIVRVRLEAKLQNIVYKKISKKSKKRALEYLEELEND